MTLSISCPLEMLVFKKSLVENRILRKMGKKFTRPRKSGSQQQNYVFFVCYAYVISIVQLLKQGQNDDTTSWHANRDGWNLTRPHTHMKCLIKKAINACLREDFFFLRDKSWDSLDWLSNIKWSAIETCTCRSH